MNTIWWQRNMEVVSYTNLQKQQRFTWPQCGSVQGDS